MLKDKSVMYAVLLLILVLQVVAISTEYWSVKASDDKIPKLNMGLWKLCMDSAGGNAVPSCVHLPPEGDKNFAKNSLYAVRAFSVLGAVLVVIALLCSEDKKMMKCHSMLMAGAGISSLVACVIWASELLSLKGVMTQDVKLKAGYSFYLNLVAGVGAVLFSLAHMGGK